MKLEEFCVALHKLNLSQRQQGLAILWFLDAKQPGASRTPGELARLFRESGLGEPHSTRLGEGILKTGHASSVGQRLRLKPTSRGVIAKWVSSIVDQRAPAADQASGLLPKAIWEGTDRSGLEACRGVPVAMNRQQEATLGRHAARIEVGNWHEDA